MSKANEKPAANNPAKPGPKPRASETPRQRFVRVQTERVKSALKTMSKIGDVAELRRMEYGRDDIDAIMRALNGKMESLRDGLAAGISKDAIKADDFTL